MGAGTSWKGTRIYTIGHSTRTVEELVGLLRPVGVSVVADIRTIPRSRHNPQFNGAALRAALWSRSIRYVHLSGLGGLRTARKDSRNTGWRNASFRGFADYMESQDFEVALGKLNSLAANGAVALMCAEAVPWHCHRSLVADALSARGAEVEHIIGSARTMAHRLTPSSKVEGERVSYPREEAASGSLPTRPPFHLEATVRVLQRRPTNRVELWENGRYLRVLGSQGHLALVEVENHGTIDAPDVRLAIHGDEPSAAALARLEETVRRVLGLDLEPTPVERLAEASRALRPTALALRGMRPPRFADWFEAFANVLPFQQLSLDAGLSIVGRLVERFGSRLEHRGRRFHAFPTAATVAGARLATLRGCGLSTRKAEWLRCIARLIESGDLAETNVAAMTTPDALRALQELPGIGPWSAALVLLRGLGRLDVFPPGDVGAQRRLVTLMRLRSDASLGRVVEDLGAARGYLYFCGLGGSLVAQGLVHAAPPPPPPSRRRASPESAPSPIRTDARAP